MRHVKLAKILPMKILKNCQSEKLPFAHVIEMYLTLPMNEFKMFLSQG